MFIDRNQGRVRGFVQLFPTHSTVALGPSLLLEDLFVIPDARGEGVATGLIATAMEYAREIGAVGMYLETGMDNRVAQRLYERCGWVCIGVVAVKFRNGVTLNEFVYLAPDDAQPS